MCEQSKGGTAVNPGLTQKTGRMTTCCSTEVYWKWKDGKYKRTRKPERKKN